MLPQAEWNSDKMSKMSQIFSPVFFFGGGWGWGYWVVGGNGGLIAKMYTCIIYMNRFFIVVYLLFLKFVLFSLHTQY